MAESHSGVPAAADCRRLRPRKGTAARLVVISGATGLSAAEVNGRFEQVEREVYRKVGQPDTWLFGWWASQPTRTTGRRSRTAGLSRWRRRAGCRRQPGRADGRCGTIPSGSSRRGGGRTVLRRASSGVGGAARPACRCPLQQQARPPASLPTLRPGIGVFAADSSGNLLRLCVGCRSRRRGRQRGRS